MKQLIKAVQKVFVVLLGVSVVVGAVGVPLGRDGELTRVERELERFVAAFDQQHLEQALLSMAQGQGLTKVSQVVEKVEAAGKPESITVADGDAGIAPLAAIELSTLEAIHHHSRPDATLAIAQADVPSLATALSWRMARYGREAEVVVDAIALERADVDEADVAREAETQAAREKKLETARALNRATKKSTEADELYKARVKWRASWKMVVRADEKRKEAAAEVDVLQKQLAEETERYDALSAAALKYEAADAHGESAPTRGLAKISLHIDGKEEHWLVPARLEVKDVPVSPLSASTFPALHETGLWDDVAAMAPADALAEIQTRFSWHHGTVGLALLQGLPLLLPILLLILVLRIRAVSDGYSPFNTDGRGGLPQVGLGQPMIDAAIATTLPATACALCAWSLYRLGHLPAVPVLSCIAAVIVGLLSFGNLRELRTLTDAVVRSHSAPPPPGVLDRQ